MGCVTICKLCLKGDLMINWGWLFGISDKWGKLILIFLKSSAHSCNHTIMVNVVLCCILNLAHLFTFFISRFVVWAILVREGNVSLVTWWPQEKISAGSHLGYKFNFLVAWESWGEPGVGRDLVKAYIPSRALRSSDQGLLCVPKIRTKKYGTQAFAYAAPVHYNALPLEVRASPSLNTFKSRLKTHFFRQSYGEWMIYMFYCF